MKLYKVILAGDHTIVMAGLELIIESDANLQVIGKVNSGTGVLNLLKSGLLPDIVIADFFMPQMGGLDLLKHLSAAFQPIKILMMSSDHTVDTISAVMGHGALGFICKNLEVDELLFAIKQVAQGKKYLSGEHWQKLLENVGNNYHSKKEAELSLLPTFNDREIAILTFLSEGESNKEISERLFMSVRTVEGYRKRLLEKTMSKNTANLIKYAVVNCIIS